MKIQSNKVLLSTIVLVSLSLSACAFSGHRGGHAAPKEAGQAAFAALAEIVDMLNRDKNTNWETVDIDALRRHLVDMNALTLNAQVSTAIDGLTITHQVSGDGITLRALHAMVPAHAKQLTESFKWDTNTERTANGATLTIKANDPKQLQRFKALGFFGVMATGSHHQAHHFQMASGQSHVHDH